MPRIEFERIDLNVHVRSARDAASGAARGPVVRVGLGRELREIAIPRDVFNQWRSRRGIGENVLTVLGLDDALLKDWVSRRPAQRDMAPSGAVRSAADPSFGSIFRIVLNLDDRRLSRLDWETPLTKALRALPDTITRDLHGPIIVRASPVLPRHRLIPLTLPMRFLYVEPSGNFHLARRLTQIFNRPQIAFADAAQVEECQLYQLSKWRKSLNWPTAEVIHFGTFSDFAGPDLFDTNFDSERDWPLTLGRLSRMADTWQTRLIILECPSPQAMLAREFASALVGRGGPAVLVCAGSDAARANFLDSYYEQLIHDFPLDVCMSIAADTPEIAASLFAGTHREDALRVSTLGLQLSQISEQFNELYAAKLKVAPKRKLLDFEEGDTPRASARALYDFMSYSPKETKAGGTGAAPRKPVKLLKLFREVRNDWNLWRFDEHERDGFLPLAEQVRKVRDALGVQGPVRRDEMRLAMESMADAEHDPRRHVNASLWRHGETARLTRIEQRNARLRTGEVVQLQIQIGPKDIRVRTIGETALLEEVFKWTPEMAGAWVEIGVTGIDFDVAGDPVQELWLPRTGPSDIVSFAVTPRRPGVSRLRFCLYFRCNVVQSFRLAAIVSGTDQPDAPADESRSALASALDIAPEAVPAEAGFVTRREFMLDDLSTIERCNPRAVSIVANHSLDESVITVKAPNIFTTIVRKAGDPEVKVAAIRKALEQAEIEFDASTPPRPLRYRYSADNVGTPEVLKESLRKLAELGWNLFSALIPQSEREKLALALDEEGRVIQVAQILLEKVFPWAAIYDRPYDKDRKYNNDGKPVAHDVCLAALPDKNGDFPFTQCGRSPQCPLHPSNKNQPNSAGEVPDEATTVCPLGFWGFKHQIEIPPQQDTTGNGTTPVMHESIMADGELKLAVGVHGGLGLLTQHLQKLKELFDALPGGASYVPVLYARDDVRIRLENPDIDLVYLYCHAEEDPSGTHEPSLVFRALANGASDGRITSAQLGNASPWEHHPLVILNGCGTVSFSPKSLSPFITALVQDRGASGVIGTEIPVYEELAGEMMVQFLQRFLPGKTGAAEALLQARRALLSRNNPLGLAYTLYAAADLAIRRTDSASPAKPATATAGSFGSP